MTILFSFLSLVYTIRLKYSAFKACIQDSLTYTHKFYLKQQRTTLHLHRYLNSVSPHLNSALENQQKFYERSFICIT